MFVERTGKIGRRVTVMGERVCTAELTGLVQPDFGPAAMTPSVCGPAIPMPGP